MKTKETFKNTVFAFERRDVMFAKILVSSDEAEDLVQGFNKKFWVKG